MTRGSFVSRRCKKLKGGMSKLAKPNRQIGHNAPSTRKHLKVHLHDAYEDVSQD